MQLLELCYVALAKRRSICKFLQAPEGVRKWNCPVEHKTPHLSSSEHGPSWNYSCNCYPGAAFNIKGSLPRLKGSMHLRPVLFQTFSSPQNPLFASLRVTRSHAMVPQRTTNSCEVYLLPRRSGQRTSNSTANCLRPDLLRRNYREACLGFRG